MTPENKPKNRQLKKSKDNPLKKGLAFVKAKKNRSLVIGVAVILVLVVVLALSLASEDAETNQPIGPSEVTVTPNEQPTPPEESGEPEPSNSTAPEGSESESEAPSETESHDRNVITEAPPEDVEPIDESQLDQADFPPGNPASRGGLPEEFPLVDSYTYTGMEEQENRVIINGTVEDSNHAIWVLDANLAKDYSVSFRQVDPGRTTARYNIEGPMLPAGTQVVVTSDGQFTVRVPQE